ncbi:probable receptor-like protein kinase At1g49730 isoform X1 [Triticum urartu]|uniref:probable receptor-like protein kinase At1g49730 isoform X1 n=1 Tax=Triticum urartu TaxID=4572 RepID=UPI0020441C1A|nr:probable receptor-like protein kinase At1g49730 isoform X1 [Triticum urartu]
MGCLHQRLGRTRVLPFVRRFKPSEIEAATRGFSTALETGGPRGTAYRARFADGLVATVRRAGGGDPDQEGQEGAFYRELQLLGRLNHRHVVRLRGFSEGHNRFLVFDQMENRSLKECLHDPLRTPLNWRTRLQVAIDVAAALEYLYYFCDPPVFHVTVNSSNVLMDADFVAKFQLSNVSVVGHDSSEGSHAEERIQQRRTELVFQYGVLLLELVTGQSPGGGDGELVRWVQEPGFAGSMQRMVDADLGGTYDAGELRDLVIVARLCTRPGSGTAVVSIPQVLRYLQGKVGDKNR